MNVSMRLSSGKADPFGVLVLAVVLALCVTIGIQAQASSDDVQRLDRPAEDCTFSCGNSAEPGHRWGPRFSPVPVKPADPRSQSPSG